MDQTIASQFQLVSEAGRFPRLRNYKFPASYGMLQIFERVVRWSEAWITHRLKFSSRAV